MNIKSLLLLLSISTVGSALVLAAPGGGNGQGAGPRGNGSRGNAANCTQTGPGQATPVRDGSGKAKSPGKGAKDGSGNKANCPVSPNP
jgi:hypothetical protein